MSSSLLQPTHHDTYPFIDPSDQLAGSAKGKSVLITGAGLGIGRAIAEAFALAGPERLVLVGRREAGLRETRERIRGKVGLVGDGFVVGDGEVARDCDLDGGGCADSDPEMWWRDLEVNLKGTYLVARRYIRALREYYGSTTAGNGHGRTEGKVEGRIINVSSNASWRYVPGRSSYAASKLAINSLTEYLDGEEGSDVVDSTTGHSKNTAIVRSVALHPGGVDTDLAATLPEDVRKRILIDKPELAAGTCVYLSLPRADFLMGRFVNCTWDMEELEKQRERMESQDLLKSKVMGMFDTLPAP
ncbi:hypothetical protein D0860_00646 [Hortaea werneckii]|uniref:Uncharacterized protein n=1 Tax=Hortaea werneckii TaxID=91943 RepID=A0A3M7HV71_HORWE|nr:hypothetical protein D0860_00646 [Hortaea werneckii]